MEGREGRVRRKEGAKDGTREGGKGKEEKRFVRGREGLLMEE